MKLKEELNAQKLELDKVKQKMAQEKILSSLLKLTFRTFAMPESPSALSFVDSENYKIQVYSIVLQLRL